MDPGANPQGFIELVLLQFQACATEDATMESYRLCAGADHQAGLDRLFALLRCELPSPKEQNWDWRQPELKLRQAIVARRTGPHGYDHKMKYNGHPIISEYFGAYCMDGLAMALWSLWHTQSFSQCVARVVNLLGDADSTGAIAGQMAGALYGWRGLVQDDWGMTCLSRLRAWDPLAEIGLRAALLYHHPVRPEVALVQAEGHPTVRVYQEPPGRPALVGELASRTHVA